MRLATFSHVYIVRMRSWATSGGTNLLSRASWTALCRAATKAEMVHKKVKNLYAKLSLYKTNLARLFLLLLWPFILAYHYSEGKTANKLCQLDWQIQTHVTIPIGFHTREARAQAYWQLSLIHKSCNVQISTGKLDTCRPLSQLFIH